MKLFFKGAKHAGASSWRVAALLIVIMTAVFTALPGAKTFSLPNHMAKVNKPGPAGVGPSPTPCETISFAGSFVSSQPADAATQQAWSDFINSLNPSAYAMVTISGTNDPVGRSLYNPTIVPQIANAMKTGGSFTYFDPVATLFWNVGQCENTVAIDATGCCSNNVCACEGAGYTVRPQVTDPALLWGGVNSLTCPPEGNQTITVTFEAGCCAAVTSNLISWWPGEGNANDIVSHHNGTIEDATFTNGEVGQAFNFDGVDDDVSIPDRSDWNFGTGEFTFDFWQRSDSTDRMHALSFEPDPTFASNNLDFNFNDSAGIYVYWNGGGNNSIQIGNSGTYTDGQWHHFALTRSGSTFT